MLVSSVYLLILAWMAIEAPAEPRPELGPADLDWTAIAAETWASEQRWTGAQFLGVDHGGRVYLLEGDTLEVHRLRGDHLQSEETLEEMPSMQAAQAPRRAEMGDDPGSWLLLGYREDLRLFEDGREVPIVQPEWSVEEIAWIDGQPAIAVLPYRRGGPVDGVDAVYPRVQTWDASRQRWETLYGAELPTPEIGEWRAELAAELAPDPHGGLWILHRHHFTALHLSAAGQELERLVVRSQGIEMLDRPPEQIERLEAFFADRSDEDKAMFERIKQSQMPTTRIKGALVSPDGRLYLLRQPDDAPKEAPSWALDRWEPILGQLDRLYVEGLELRGLPRLAAGRDGLYLVGFDGETPRYRLPWWQLDGIEWVPVLGVELE